MVRMKKDANARVTGRRKQTKESAAEQLYMDNIPMGLVESDDSSDMGLNSRVNVNISDRCQVPKFLLNRYFLLTPSFCAIDTIAITSSVRPTFAS